MVSIREKSVWKKEEKEKERQEMMLNLYNVVAIIHYLNNVKVVPLFSLIS